jgi:dimethylaniline monooxygenase (N-oxide forming)
MSQGVQNVTVKEIAIVGAGAAGLVAADEAARCGLKPTVFEKTSKIGGIWQPNIGSTWDNLKTNISFYTCMFSKFAWKKNPAGDFPTRDEVYEYLCDFVKTNELEKYLRLNTEIKQIYKFEDRWKVTWVTAGKKDERAFDFVIIASGFFSKAAPFSISGIENFNGRIMHSKSYKNSTPFKGKKVAVFGESFSGCEIAADLVSSAEKVIHVAPKSFWILPRHLKNPKDPTKDLPGDLIFYSRASQQKSAGISLEEVYVKKHSWFRTICDQGKKCPDLEVTTSPKHPPYVAISDQYVDSVAKKYIDVKKIRVDRLEKGKIVFQDGKSEQIDSIIYCTGYRTELPFFNHEILKALEFLPEDKFQPLLLHKTVFPKNLSGLAFVGMYRGPFFGAMELQARWACMAFSGKIPLPSQPEIEQGIIEEQKIREMQPRPQFPHGDYVGFCEDLAKQIGVAPDLAKIETEDPKLFQKLVNGPFTVASYRLHGYGNDPQCALHLIEQINSATVPSLRSGNDL